jgi:hypothetical protein
VLIALRFYRADDTPWTRDPPPIHAVSRML